MWKATNSLPLKKGNKYGYKHCKFKSLIAFFNFGNNHLPAPFALRSMQRNICQLKLCMQLIVTSVSSWIAQIRLTILVKKDNRS